MAQTLYLLDAYALIYRTFHAFSHRPLIDAQGRNTTALYGFALTLQDLIDKESPDLIAVARDMPGGTFRHEAYTDYKANRSETPNEIREAIPHIERLLQAYQIPLIGVPGYEADDVIGTLAEQAAKEGYQVRMVTPDKDYGQLVTPLIQMLSPHQRTGKGFQLLGEREIVEKYGLRTPKQMIDYLGLVGDTSDNVPGCKGIGKKGAETLLQQFNTIEEIYSHLDEVPEKLARMLEASREQTLLSRDLVTIVTNVPGVHFNAAELRWRGGDHEAIEAFFKEFAFTSLLRRLRATPEPNKSPEPGTHQPSLFDTMVSKSTTLANHQSVGVTFETVEGREAIQRLVERLEGVDVLAFDTETDGLDPLRANLVGVSLCADEQEAFWIPLPEDEAAARRLLQPLQNLLGSDQIIKVAHNAKFDLHLLDRYGLSIPAPLYDTMLAHYLLDADQSHSLDNLASGLLNYDTIRYDDLTHERPINLRSNVAPERLRDYAAEDAYVALRLYRILEQRLDSASRRLLLEIEMPLLSVLMRMEQHGIALDIPALEASKSYLEKQCLALERAIQSYAPEGQALNVNSPKQIGALLFEHLRLQQKPRKTKSGGYVTNEETIAKIQHLHPVIPLILEYREAKKLLTTYVKPLPKMLYPDGRLHTSYNQAVAATGRLSSSNPNLQNIPIRSDLGRPLRSAFVAAPRPGAQLLSADYSQVELRVIAHLSGDAALIDAFRSGSDIHTATAARIFKVPEEQVTPLMRSKAKTANFGINYGITPYGLSQRLNIPLGEATELINDYFATFPDVLRYMEEAKASARKKGYAETAFGRRRYLRGLQAAVGANLGVEERNAINAPIQGTAADIIKRAMVELDRQLCEGGYKSYLVLQVHDELVVNLFDDERERVAHLVRSVMENAWPECSVPLPVEIGIGDDWLQAH